MKKLILPFLALLLLLAWPQPTAAQSEDPPPDTHTVTYGDTLYKIARRYGLDVNDLRRLNEVGYRDVIYVGQTLRLTAADESPPTATASGPTATATESKTVSTLQGDRLHTVAAGDSLIKIGRRYGIDPAVLTAYNQIAAPDLLYVGDQIRIPADPMAVDLPAPIPAADKTVVVDISEQRTYTYNGDQLVHEFVVSTGLPGLDTRPGTYEIQNKLPNGYNYNWGLTMPYWLGIYWAGPLQNGFHALPIDAYGNKMWADLLGAPASYGCIVLGDQDAATLYAWVDIGTTVEIRP